MASNLSSIGFHFSDDAGFTKVMTRLAEEAGEHVGCAAGDYAVWRCRSGAAIWFHLAAEREGTREIVGLTPFFEGASEVPVRVTSRQKRSGDNAFEGALYAWIAPEAGEADGQEGAYPALIEAVDFGALAEQELPVLARMQICGFAHELRAFPTAEAHRAADDQQPGIASEAFIPMGLFTAATRESIGDPEPSAAALVTGTVAEHRLLTNSVTGQHFHWLLVESFAASYDIVADPAVVTGQIATGGTIEASCTLFSRLLE